MPELPVLPSELQDWRPILDLELNQLSEKYRAPIVLCDLEGCSRKEAAVRLKTPEGTLSSRLNRARAQLAERLKRHGVTLGSAALAAAISDEALAAVPSGLAFGTSKAALLVASGRTVELATPATILMEGVMKSMLICNLKGVVGAAFVTAIIAVGVVGYWSSRLVAAPPQDSNNPKPPMAVENSQKADDSAKLLRAVTEGHRANLKAIRSIHATLHMKSEDNNPNRSNSRNELFGQWWEENGKIRWQEMRTQERGRPYGVLPDGSPAGMPFDTIEEVVMDAGKRMCLKRHNMGSGGEALTGEVWKDPRIGPCLSDIWCRMGFVVLENPRLSVAECLESRDWSKEVRNRREGDENFVEVVCRRDQNNVELCFSPSHGYLVKRLDYWAGPKKEVTKLRLLLEIDGIKESAPGVFMPTHSVRKFFLAAGPNGPRITNETSVEIVSINKPLPENTFASPIPEGTRTVDPVNQLFYTMGPDGNPSPDYPIQPLHRGPRGSNGPPTPPKRDP